MSAAPVGDQGDALERLADEQHHIMEIFETYARCQRDAGARPAEAARLGSLVATLLRVHAELETGVLEPALVQQTAAHAVLSRTAAQRAAALEALERVEAMAPGSAAHAREMQTLRERVRGWFESNEQQLFPVARAAPLDLCALDRQMALRQEVLLSAGRHAESNAAEGA